MAAGRAAGAPVGTWTVLFTDQVGSTGMRVAMGEAAFDRIRADLDACVGAALAAHSVAVTKSTGDGVMAGFTSTAAALQCAVAIQQAIAERNRAAGEGVGGDGALAVRIGISVGDAVIDNGDLQGTAVVEAARLCAVASGGTILCSEAVRVVSANRSGCTFGPASPADLKGLPGPVLTHEVVWAPPPYRADATRLAFRVLGPLEVVDGDRVVSVARVGANSGADHLLDRRGCRPRPIRGDQRCAVDSGWRRLINLRRLRSASRQAPPSGAAGRAPSPLAAIASERSLGAHERSTRLRPTRRPSPSTSSSWIRGLAQVSGEAEDAQASLHELIDCREALACAAACRRSRTGEPGRRCRVPSSRDGAVEVRASSVRERARSAGRFARQG